MESRTPAHMEREGEGEKERKGGGRKRKAKKRNDNNSDNMSFLRERCFVCVHALALSCCFSCLGYYSHSVVPGGFDVMSYITRPTNGSCWSSVTMLLRTSTGMLSVPGTAGTPVMKSLVMKVRMTML